MKIFIFVGIFCDVIQNLSTNPNWHKETFPQLILIDLVPFQFDKQSAYINKVYIFWVLTLAMTGSPNEVKCRFKTSCLGYAV
jgi:hypothetical protein